MKSNKMIHLKRYVALIFFILVLISCEKKNSKEGISYETDACIVKKCLTRLHENGSKQSYLISPKYGNFEFNDFFRKNKILEDFKKGYNYNQKKEEILGSVGWTDKKFREIQRNINKKYLNKTNTLFLKLSNSDISHTVFFFSGIQEDLVFVDVVVYCNSIKISELASSSFDKNQKFMSLGSIIFLLKDGEIQDMTFDSDITLDFNCPD
jgi:hypothetical protein